MKNQKHKRKFTPIAKTSSGNPIRLNKAKRWVSPFFDSVSHLHVGVVSSVSQKLMDAFTQAHLRATRRMGVRPHLSGRSA